MNLIVYDGVCIVCNRFIKFVIKIDRRNKLIFCELQSDKGRKLLRKYDLPLSDFDTIYFLSNGKLYEKSNAILNILQLIGGFWSFSVVFYLVPRKLRDKIYDFIAENRYRFFSQRNQCKISNDKVLKNIL